MKQAWRQFSVMAFVLICIFGICEAQNSEDALKKAFENPPSTARAARLVALDEWQHHARRHQTRPRMDAPVRDCGIPEFRCGPAGATGCRQAVGVHDPGMGRRVQVRHSPWDQFGMEMAIAGSPGWSDTGGPWVPPAHGMKKYGWTETVHISAAMYLLFGSVWDHWTSRSFLGFATSSCDSRLPE